MTREETIARAREVLDHKTRSYVQAAADLSAHLLGLDAELVELVARLRGRAESCRRTHRAHLDAGRPDVAAQALARAEAYEVALEDVERSLA